MKKQLIGLIDKSIEFVPHQYKNEIPYLGNDEIIQNGQFRKKYSNSYYIISPDLPDVREKLFNKYKCHRHPRLKTKRLFAGRVNAAE